MSSYDCPGRYEYPLGYTDPPWMARARRLYEAQGHLIPASWGTRYGVCSACGKAVSILNNGTIRSHVASGITAEAMQARRAKTANREQTKNERATADLRKLLKRLS